MNSAVENSLSVADTAPGVRSQGLHDMAIWGTTIALPHGSRSNIVVRPWTDDYSSLFKLLRDLNSGTGNSGNTSPWDAREAQGFNVGCHEIYRELSIPRKPLFSDTPIN
jgi:hypothetical protein